MSTSKPALAFAGLGTMGFGMASHLIKSGFPLIGYDIYQPLVDRLVAAGGQAAQTPRDAVKDVEFCVCMVAKIDDAVLLLFDPKAGAVSTMPSNITLLMCSTVAPADIEMLMERLKEAGRPDIRLIDSPVSGGAGRAANGTLSIFASGKDDDLDNAQPILECLSSKLYRIGGLGGGSKAKLIHQIYAGVHIAMGNEAMALAALSGLNTQEAYEYLRKSDANSWMFSNRVTPMLDPSMPPYSSIAIIKKDVAIITKTCREENFPLPVLEKAEELYVEASAAGWEKEDDCVLVRLYLPGQPDLVMKQANVTQAVHAPMLSIDNIKDLMIGVHLAAVCEAMRFCRHLEIDTDLIFDIVSNAAGASAVFVKHFREMQKQNFALRDVSDADGIKERLKTACQKATNAGFRTTLSTSAVQSFEQE